MLTFSPLLQAASGQQQLSQEYINLGADSDEQGHSVAAHSNGSVELSDGVAEQPEEPAVDYAVNDLEAAAEAVPQQSVSGQESSHNSGQQSSDLADDPAEMPPRAVAAVQQGSCMAIMQLSRARFTRCWQRCSA